MIATAPARHNTSIKWLTYMMFLMFALTTDSVGKIIPEIIKAYHLSMTAGGAPQYATMSGIALAAIFLGFLADRLGRKKTIILGLTLFALNSYLFAISSSYAVFLVLFMGSGVSIGVFKTGALALIGDISGSTVEHTSTMNKVEGFYGIGSITGPAIIVWLLAAGVSWKWIYLIAGTICAVLIVVAALVRYPTTMKPSAEPVDLKRTAHMFKNPYALGFSMACFLYVTVECAVYVWLPTYLTVNKPSSACDCSICSVDFLCTPGCRQVHRSVGAGALELDHRSCALQRRHFGMFPGRHVRRNQCHGLLVGTVRPLHVGHLSHAELQGHQLLSQVRTWRGCGRDPLFHLRRRRPWTTGYGRGERPIRRTAGRIRAGHIFAALLFLGLIYNWAANPTRAVLQQSDATDYGIVEA